MWAGHDDLSLDERIVRSTTRDGWMQAVIEARRIDGIPVGSLRGQTVRPMFEIRDEHEFGWVDAASWPEAARWDLDRLDRSVGRTSRLTPTVDRREKEQE